jgi:hypothetical protein
MKNIDSRSVTQSVVYLESPVANDCPPVREQRITITVVEFHPDCVCPSELGVNVCVHSTYYTDRFEGSSQVGQCRAICSQF